MTNINDPLSRIQLSNVVFVVPRLLSTDVCALLVKQDPKFSLEIKALRELCHRYRYASAIDRPPGLSLLDWVEQLGAELVQLTQHCVSQLNALAQRQLIASLQDGKQYADRTWKRQTPLSSLPRTDPGVAHT